MEDSIGVDIIIPCYNAEKYIEQSIMSALNQTYPNKKVIFVDNESTDNSLKIAKNLQKENPNLIVTSAKNIYPRCWDEAREKGFSLGDGEYIFTLAADDYYHESYVENCMKYISHDPGRIKAFQSPIRNFSSHMGIKDEFISHTYKNIQEFKKISLSKCPATSPTVVFSRELYLQGLLKTKPELYSGAADYDLYCSLADNGIFIYPANKWLGYYYRWHPQQATWEMHKDSVNYDKLIQEYWSKKWQI